MRFHFREWLIKEASGARSARLEGVFTPKQSGDFLLEVSGIGEARAGTKSVEIDGQAVQPGSSSEPWKFPTYPFHAESGKPIRFAIETEKWNVAFRLVRAVPVKREVYLPAGQDWYDFWTGGRIKGGETRTVESPLSMMPLYVRAGAILPMGPELQWADEKSADPIELRVYRGANGAFTLYEDEGDGFGYKKGAYAKIPFTWDEASQSLTIGKREGSFPGILASRTVQIVWVKESHGTSGEVTAVPDQKVLYSGGSRHREGTLAEPLPGPTHAHSRRTAPRRTCRPQLRLRVLNGSKVVSEQTQAGNIAGYGNARFTFNFTAPTAPGDYTLEAALVLPGKPPTQSLRDFKISQP